MKLKWKTDLKNSIIDCAFIDGTNEIIAGNVSGDLTILNDSGDTISKIECGLPVWGVAATRFSIAVAMGAKSPDRGAVMVLDRSTLEPVSKTALNVPAWDAAFSPQGSVLATTWGRGLLCVPPEGNSHFYVDHAHHLYGISTTNHNALITSSGSGLCQLDFDNPTSITTLTQTSQTACYKNALSSDGRLAIFGSSSNELHCTTLADNRTTKLSVRPDGICGLASFGDFVIYGGLDGTLELARIDNLAIPISRVRMNGGIWSIRHNQQSGLLLLACGDGFLYCFDSSNDSLFESSVSNSASGQIRREIFQGARVFICHAHEDQEVAMSIYDGLQTEGCRPWLDKRDLLPGENWKATIPREIRQSDFVVICISDHTFSKRGYVQKEVRMALETIEEIPPDEIFIIPIRIGDCTMPDSLSHLQYVDYRSPDFFQKVLLAIQKTKERRPRR